MSSVNQGCVVVTLSIQGGYGASCNNLSIRGNYQGKIYDYFGTASNVYDIDMLHENPVPYICK